MKSFFDDLDRLIEQAVASATNTEKSLQKKQADSVKERGVKAEDSKEKKEDVEEAEDDEKKEKPDDESIEKLKGDEIDAEQPKVMKKSNDVPGTRTSEKLSDPPPSVITNPGFEDIKSKVNVLRGTSSFTDERVSDSVKTYLNSLSTAEKSALLTYLTNLAQIMAPVKSPKEVTSPSKLGIRISFSGKKMKGAEKPEPEAKPTLGKKNDKVIVVGGK